MSTTDKKVIFDIENIVVARSRLMQSWIGLDAFNEIIETAPPSKKWSCHATALYENNKNVIYSDAYKATVNGYIHYVDIESSNGHRGRQAKNWCIERQIEFLIGRYNYQFFFKDGEDAAMFKLTWS